MPVVALRPGAATTVVLIGVNCGAAAAAAGLGPDGAPAASQAKTALAGSSRRSDLDVSLMLGKVTMASAHSRAPSTRLGCDPVLTPRCEVPLTPARPSASPRSRARSGRIVAMHARVAIVSGAAGGLGSAIAERLGAEGFAVAACDLAPTHGCAMHAQLDVTDGEAVRAFAARVEAGVGPVDLVVTAAGIQRTGSSEMVPER